MSKQYSSQIANELIEYMKANHLDYYFNQDEGSIEFDIPIPVKISRVHFFIRIHKWGYTSFGDFGLAVQEPVRDDMIEYLTFVNYNAAIGYFEFDIAKGKLSYKVTVDCDGCTLSQKIIGNSLSATLMMYQEWGDHLLYILVGVETAAKAIAQIQAEGFHIEEGLKCTHTRLQII